ncbi:hypothetical protein AAHC03_024295 [Spirometra sp. Aus1]
MMTCGKSRADAVAGGESCAVSLETLHTNIINSIALRLLQSNFIPRAGGGGSVGCLARQTVTRQSDNRVTLLIVNSDLRPLPTHCLS